MRQSKQEHERDIFRSFVKAAGLSIDLRSVRSPKEPLPDISCRLNGVPSYFELTRMAHRKTASARGYHLNQLARTGAAPPLPADIYNDRTALRETIGRKTSKKY